MYKFIDIYVYSKIDLLRLSYLNLSSENKQCVFYLNFQIIIITSKLYLLLKFNTNRNYKYHRFFKQF